MAEDEVAQKGHVPAVPCAWHQRLQLGYVAWHEEAEQRTKAGREQRQCPDCHRWLWADEWGTPPKGGPLWATARQTAAAGDVVRVEWPGEPGGRLARVVRWTRTGKPVVRFYHYTVSAERTVEARLAPGSSGDQILANTIDGRMALEAAADADGE